MQKISSLAFADSKPHYVFLDGLRGVAVLLVIWYHVFEGFATSPIDQKFNHGYLVVDFFFILSGFVIGYAHDDHQKTTTTQKEFLKRRLVRLHPMVVMGAVLGAITSCIQGYEQWGGARVSTSIAMVAMLLNLFLISAVPGTGPEVHGNGEVYPLSGPSWSLFFEYIGNILYALLIRRIPTKAPTILVVIAGIGLASLLICNLSDSHYLGVGWSMVDYNPIGGSLYMLFTLSIGLLMSRIFKPVHIKGAFWICSLLILISLTVPCVGGETSPQMNSTYDVVCTILISPLLVYLGASGKTIDKGVAKICKFLGDISYPVYIIHYPLMYLFYAWLWSKESYITFSQPWPVALCVFFGSTVLTYLRPKSYDESVRKWLSKKLLTKK